MHLHRPVYLAVAVCRGYSCGWPSGSLGSRAGAVDQLVLRPTDEVLPQPIIS